MAANNSVEENYAGNAKIYDQFLTLPLGTIEQQLYKLSYQDCTGLKVLDIGGGTGLRAREVLDAGAQAVDVVDISREMMLLGQEYEKSIGRDRIKWYQGDATKPLDHLRLGPYDLVIANGMFDHAHNVEEYEAMWCNAAAYLKPGGRVITNRNNPQAQSGVEGRYGVILSDFQDHPGGVTFQYSMLTNPRLDFQSIALEVYYSGSLEIPGKYFEDFRVTPFEETAAVKADPEFWRLYLADPITVIFTATKKAG